MSKAIAAIGTQLKSGDGGSPEAFVNLGEVLDITGPEGTLAELDVTNHSSPNDFKEYIPGVLDAGTVTFEMNMIQSNSAQQRIHQDWRARAQRHYQLIFPVDPDNTPLADRTIQFSAFVSKFSYLAPVAGVLRRSLTLRVTTAPQFGVGT
jgi:hypothetical protein